jgi:hypothetical protein
LIPPAVYIIDYAKLVLWLLPGYLRQTKTIAWLNVAVSPVVYLYQQFVLFRKNKLYEISITPQVCRLETLLNDKFDFTQRRIYIDDAPERGPEYFYKEPELQPVFLYRESEALPVYFHTESEGAEYGDDFIVYVPLTLVFDNAEMRSLVKKFKLPGMKFKIQTF